jgi:hypothetical protein
MLVISGSDDDADRLHEHQAGRDVLRTRARFVR